MTLTIITYSLKSRKENEVKKYENKDVRDQKEQRDEKL